MKVIDPGTMQGTDPPEESVQARERQETMQRLRAAIVDAWRARCAGRRNAAR
jgi:hypothetical protein